MCGGCWTANMTARAMSSGCSASICGGLSKNGVSVMPGSITVTRTPVSLKSWRGGSPPPGPAPLGGGERGAPGGGGAGPPAGGGEGGPGCFGGGLVGGGGGGGPGG